MPDNEQALVQDWHTLLPSFATESAMEDSWVRKHSAVVATRSAHIQEFIEGERYWSLEELKALLNDTNAKYGYRKSVEDTLQQNSSGTEEGLRAFQDRWRTLYRAAGKDDSYLTPEGFETILQAFKNIGSGFHTEFLSNLYPHRFWQLNGIVDRFLEGAHFEWPQGSSSPAKKYFATQPTMDAIRGALAKQQLPSDYRMADHFIYWAVDIMKYGKKDESPKPRYWKIAPGSQAHLWEEWLRGNYIALGWEETGDISQMTHEEFEKCWGALQARSPTDFGAGGSGMVWRFSHEMKAGDRVVANRGTQEVLGIGTVTGDYTFEKGKAYSHRRAVRWDDTTARSVKEGGWTKTLIEIGAEKFQAIAGNLLPPPPPHRDAALTQKAFDLLADLTENPTKNYYSEHFQDFKAFLEEPFQKLMTKVADELPEPMKAVLETRAKVFSRILKNDYGRGGAWDYYWGAFYPKGSSRIEDAQLFIWINKDKLRFGFYIGDRGQEAKARLRENCARQGKKISLLLKEAISDKRLTFAKDVPDEAERAFDLEQWLGDPEGLDGHVAVVLPREEVLGLSQEDLIAQVRSIFEQLFPLVLLAGESDPFPKIKTYLIGEEPELYVNPPYSLINCSEETGYDVSVLERWLRVVRRKGQAILYGPPGTGKTFLAERLAKLLVSDGDGIVELVQFHPSYSYEEFIEGIRPQARSDGGLDYSMVSGRFLAFCSKASERKGASVLVVDEINRANLSRVFGELMYLLEYRDREIPLAGGHRFGIPSKVLIIGTMNTADRSIALVDHALRRRFGFIELQPEYEVLRRFHLGSTFKVDALIGKLIELNGIIADRNYALGISFFMRNDLEEHVEDIWRMEIEPYLEELFFDQGDKIEKFRWDAIKIQVMP